MEQIYDHKSLLKIIIVKTPNKYRTKKVPQMCKKHLLIVLKNYFYNRENFCDYHLRLDPTKWSNTPKEFIGNGLELSDNFMGNKTWLIRPDSNIRSKIWRPFLGNF